MFAPRFDSVDENDPVACAGFLDLAQSLTDVEHWKRFSHDLLRPGDGDRVLDIGCGTGADVLALARRVGTSGQVVGVDLSQSLLTIAKTRAASLRLPVSFQRADIHSLPFNDGSFDCTRIDRVLHFLPDPGRALQEAVRVTAPGGRMVVTEPDWGTLTVSGGDPELTAELLGAAAEKTPGARIGSSLPRLLAEAGLQPTDRHESMLELADYATASALFGLDSVAARAIASGRVSAKEAVRWLRSLQQASAAGVFRCSLGGIIAGGIRPTTPAESDVASMSVTDRGDRNDKPCRSDDGADGRLLRRVRAHHEPVVHLGRARLGPGRRPHRRQT